MTARRAQGGRARGRSRFKTKPEIALEQIRWACEAGLPRGVGADGRRLRRTTRGCARGITELGLRYVAGIQPKMPGVATRARGPRRRGRPLNDTGRRDEPDLISVKELALGLPERGLAHDPMAGGLGRLAVLALCARCAFASPIEPAAAANC